MQKQYGAHNEEFPSFDNKMTTKNNINLHVCFISS
jgi:hypothetical protein